jgi:hypothetical protein
VSKFPYIHYIGTAEGGKDDATFTGGLRSFDALLEFVQVAARPALHEINTGAEFAETKVDTPVMFLLIPSKEEADAGNEWGDVYASVATENRFDGEFYTVAPAASADVLASLPPRPAGSSPVVVVKGDEASYFKGKAVAVLLSTWMRQARHARMAEMTHKLAAALRDETPGKIAVITVVDGFADNTATIAAMTGAAKEYKQKPDWNYQFCSMDFNLWKLYIEKNWGYSLEDTPTTLIFMPSTQQFLHIPGVFRRKQVGAGGGAESEGGEEGATEGEVEVVFDRELLVRVLDAAAADPAEIDWIGGKSLFSSIQKSINHVLDTGSVIISAMNSEYPMLIHATVVSTFLLLMTWCFQKPPKESKSNRKAVQEQEEDAVVEQPTRLKAE